MSAEPRPSRGFLPRVLALSLFCVLAVCGARSARADDAPELAPEFRADIMTMIRLTGTDSLSYRMGVQIVDLMVGQARTLRPELPSSAFVAMREEVLEVLRIRLEDLLVQVAPVYGRHFTHDEVKQLIAFYRTPLGAKLIHEMPQLMSESSEVGRVWGESLVPELSRRLEKRLSPDSSKE